jgi:catalase
MHIRWLSLSIIGIANAACPYMSRDVDPLSVDNPHGLHARQSSSGDATEDTEQFLSQFYLNDTSAFMTSDAGGPISDQASLKAGERGPTLLEDFIFRQKIQHFDHERVSSNS